MNSKTSIKVMFFICLQLSVSKVSGASFMETISRTCRIMASLYDNKLNATTDVEAMIYGPGGLRKILLPIDIPSADELISMKILDVNAITIITMHGFHDDGLSGYSLEIAKKYLEKGTYNIISFNGGNVTKSSDTEYPKMVQMYENIGHLAGEYLAHLHSRKAIRASKIHFVGMSIGAQTASKAGKVFKKLTGEKFGRITGLDPVSICYENTDENLSKNDADYVDIIHVNARYLGTIFIRGHIDFIVNGGGPFQPGCLKPFEICHHVRACLLFLESFEKNSLPLYARKCSSYLSFVLGLCNYNDLAVWGYKADRSKTGVYYLRTTGSSPYSLGLKGSKSDGLIKKLLLLFN